MSAARADELALSMPSDGRYLPLVRALVQQGAELGGFDAAMQGTIVLAVTEAVTNVIRHAYDGRTDQPIELRLHPSEGEFHLLIIDRGRYVPPEQIASRPLDEVRPGGLGVHLIKTTMDDVQYTPNEHGGTTLILRKSLHPEKETG